LGDEGCGWSAVHRGHDRPARLLGERTVDSFRLVSRENLPKPAARSGWERAPASAPRFPRGSGLDELRLRRPKRRPGHAAILRLASDALLIHGPGPPNPTCAYR